MVPKDFKVGALVRSKSHTKEIPHPIMTVHNTNSPIYVTCRYYLPDTKTYIDKDFRPDEIEMISQYESAN